MENFPPQPAATDSVSAWNKAIKQACTLVNRYIDKDYALASKAVELRDLSETRRQFQCAAHRYEEQMVALSDLYLNTACYYEKKPGRAMKELRKLYGQLLSAYSKEARINGTEVPNLQKWDVPPLQKPPQANVPRAHESRSEFTKNLSKSIFNGKQHYRAHRHFKMKGAAFHYDMLKGIYEDQLLKEDKRRCRDRFMAEQMRMISAEIESYKAQLSEESGRAKWEKSFEFYTRVVREYFGHLAERAAFDSTLPDLSRSESKQTFKSSELSRKRDRSESDSLRPLSDIANVAHGADFRLSDRDPDTSVVISVDMHEW